MKKLICAAVVAGSMFAMADEAKCENGVCALPAAAVKAEAPKTVRPKLSPEQQAEIKARREKFMAERKAAMEAKALEVVKKYVPEEEKAKALLMELREVMRPGMRLPPMPRKTVQKPAEVK